MMQYAAGAHLPAVSSKMVLLKSSRGTRSFSESSENWNGQCNQHRSLLAS
jgi:hypothetical protein